jgi:hypothetical protein
MNSTLERKLIQRVSNNVYYLYTEGTWAWEVLPFHVFMLLLQSDMLASVKILLCTLGMNFASNALHVTCYIRSVLSFSQYIYLQIIYAYWQTCHKHV